ncbi:MAG: saccharopine dehydrogenase NADP-binding domain-containing protein [Dehalococcoidia bacterium]|nr:saccharopine dehydrogenase NADP-binding domain-containing protein [Dehalococcoidia bacterium]
MKKIVVLGGAGTMGFEAVKLLLDRTEAEITVADASVKGLKRVEAELGKKVKTAGADVNDREALVKLLKGADVAISTVGPFYKYAAAVIKAAIEARVNMVDIDDDFDATKDSLDLDEAARKAGVTAIIGMGASPGVTNLVAKLGASRLDRTDDIRLYWGESAIDPTGSAAMMHWFHITAEEVPVFVNGKWVEQQGFTQPEVIEFMPPVGKLEVVLTGHPEPVSLPRYIKGVKNVSIKGALYPPKMMELYRWLIDTGFGSNELFKVNEDVSMPFRELAVRIIRSMPRFAPDYFKDVLDDALGKYEACAGTFKIVVSGQKGDSQVIITYDLMANNVAHSTALPAVIAALSMLDGKVKQSGVMAPEGALDAAMFLENLSKDATVRETVTTANDTISFK